MSVDLAVGTPTFLDMTVVGLESLPAPGEERFAGDLLRSPGGGAITAVGAARLGLSVAVAAPLGDDRPGTFVRDALAAEGVATVERTCPRMPTTIVLPIGGDRAMITVDPGARAVPDDVASLRPRAVATNLDLLRCVPAGVPGYVTCGDDDSRAYAGALPDGLSAARVLLVSESEALALTGGGGVDEALETLSRAADGVVVTLGRRGAVAVVDGERLEEPAVDAGPAVDTTGSGDLLVAAYIWADLLGLAAAERLRWAVLFASLSVSSPTAVGGAVDRDRLVAEGMRRGLPAPPA